ncbi:enoyl-CoA hydratase/isomerase family protein [Ochrobactrum sp. S46]|nr:enoyl-CoA hydratase/isomerase family protein [Ochrobactrum sp. S45]MBK0046508.1 enoyl-CoA hydratase/isomerase family protein [Ochrobactrum sp. S46]
MAVDLEMIGPVAVLKLNEPTAMNALTPDELIELRKQLRACQDNGDIRCIILTGEGKKAFCAGANLKKTFPPARSFAANLLLGRDAEAADGGYTRLLDLSDLQIWKPIIAAVNGYCLGGGLELALQCDIRIASESASFGLPEVKVASVPAVGGVQLLLRAVPAAHAMKLALTGMRIDAGQALSIGLVSDVVAADKLLPFCLDIASQITANGPLAVQHVKKLAQETAHLPPEQFIAQSNTVWGLLRDSADRIEGRNAFGEKRTPHYTGN